MPASVAQKLRIRENFILLAINAPHSFKKNIGTLPQGTKISTNANFFNQVHWFVVNKAQMEKELNAVLKLIKDHVVCWIYYPKGSSKIQTDLTRDKGWESFLKHDELQWISLISFDETWSTFGCRLKTDADKRKESKPKERPVFDYIDAEKKMVLLPDDLAKSFLKNKKAADFFNSLSFTNKKEYIEWIVTAKREETKNERITGTIERLKKGWKNPANR
jgi:Bacteriocin-protection, YdeI or OmpD-Associated